MMIIKVLIQLDGFVKMNDLLQYKSLKSSSKNEIYKIVENNSKQRFMLKNIDGEEYIRANQGHSMSTVLIDMTEITDQDKIVQCLHGTYHKCWPLIKEHVRFISYYLSQIKINFDSDLLNILEMCRLWYCGNILVFLL